MTSPTSAPSGSGLRGAVASSATGKVAEMVTLALLATVVPRALGPADYGRFAVALTVVTLGSLALTLGGPTLMTRFVPAAPVADRPAVARAIGLRLARGRAAQVAAIGLGAVVAVVARPSAFPAGVTALVVVALGVNVATSVGLQVSLGLGQAGPWSARFPVQNAVLVVAVLVLHPLAGTTGAAVAILVSALAGLALTGLVVVPLVGSERRRVPVPSGAIRFGALQAGGAALTQLSQRGGVLAVAVLGAAAVETGYAALASGIALGATYAVLQAYTVALPHLGRDGEADGATGGTDPLSTRRRTSATRDREAVLTRMTGWLLVVLVPACLVAVVVVGPVLPVVLGEGFEGAEAAFVPAIALVVVAPLHSHLVQVTALRLCAEVALAGGIAAAATFVLVAVLAVPAWAAAGGLSAVLAGMAAGVVVPLVLLPEAVPWRLVALAGVGVVAVLAVAAW